MFVPFMLFPCKTQRFLADSLLQQNMYNFQKCWTWYVMLIRNISI